MTEANELLEIWLDWMAWDVTEDKHKAYRNDRLREHYKEVWYMYKYRRNEILLFWTLKAKIDDYKKQIIHACAEVDKLTKIINKIEAKVNE